MFPRLAGSVLGLVIVFLPVQPSAQAPALRDEMHVKLTNAQQLLEAVIRGDFPAMSRSAEALGRISVTEIGEWQDASRSSAEAEYTSQGTMFVLAVQGLRVAVEEEDIDAALTEYTALISSCTRCHAYVRGRVSASLRVPALPPAAP